MSYYNAIAKSYDRLYAEEQYEKLEEIVTFLKVKKTDRLLDIGCGTGLSARFFTGHVIGIDPAFEMVKQADFPVVCGAAEELPFQSEMFDVVVCVSAIHNFDDHSKALREMKRVLKKKGIGAITLLKKARQYKTIRKDIETFFLGKWVEGKKDDCFIGMKKKEYTTK